MASKCGRFINRTTISSLRSCFAKSNSSSPLKSATPKFSFSRIPRELGCAASMMPLHNAVATARMTSCLSVSSRCCRALSQDKIDGT